MGKELIEEWERLHGATTKGDWKQVYSSVWLNVLNADVRRCLFQTWMPTQRTKPQPDDEANAAFIVFLKNRSPTLLAHIRQQAAEIERLRARVQTLAIHANRCQCPDCVLAREETEASK